MSQAVQFGALVRAFTFGACVTVKLCRGGPWAWDPSENCVLVPEEDLERKGIEACAGIVAHEAAHVRISRYHLFRSGPAGESSDLPAYVWNAMEDTRVNEFSRRAFPGTGRWIALAYKQDPPQRLNELPRVLAFAAECVHEAELRKWRSAPPGTVVDCVAEALAKTREARRRYLMELPSTELERGKVDTALYSRSVTPLLLATESELPDEQERQVRLSAARAAEIARTEILPVVRELYERDVSTLGSLFDRQSEALRLAELAIATSNEACLDMVVRDAMSTSPNAQLSPQAREAAEKALRARYHDASGERVRLAVTAGTTAQPLSQPECEMRSHGSVRSDCYLPVLRYGDALASIQGQLLTLMDSLRASLSVRPSHWATGRESGPRIDLRRMMAWDADPRRAHDGLWMRRLRPRKLEAATMLLVDCSGSMRLDGKAHAAVTGLVLLAEALQRLDLPLCVHGFQDELIPLVPWCTKLTLKSKQAIEGVTLEVQGVRAGGRNAPLYNDDGPCLTAAATELARRSERIKLLIVVTDGHPEGRHSTAADLKRAVAKVTQSMPVTLIAIGLGHRADHVRSYFPHAVANVAPGRLALTMGRLLESVLVQA